MSHEPTTRSAGAEQASPTFNTERFIVVPLTPPKLRELALVLLKDERLTELLPWSVHGANQQALLLELQLASGMSKAWGIVERSRTMFIGAVVSRQTPAAIDIEVLCASPLWSAGVAEEVGEPVLAWLEGMAEAPMDIVH